MTGDDTAAEGSAGDVAAPPLARKVDYLFRMVHPHDRCPFSLQEAAARIERLTGEKVSHNTLWKLRTGKHDNPTKRVLEALAAFFGVTPSYFFDDEVSRSIEGQIELLAVLRDTGVRGAHLRSFLQLPPEAQQMVGELIESTARLERRGQTEQRGIRWRLSLL
ncbi:helix-turn-helix domain-containing protein [Actinomadura viridis]|uniref:Transcriptional regulator with XRE-family HTH domain n=1 Tax=Actinomadura viridis TaxID=58110 RepID=A0A931DSM9_9ACTN|nr:helix-turn-helix domain-containing protein [Actinomadura viridis]MBG6093207.1 transcriptional regulator with XRE-family HTH domain [Actinomadura viridis]